MGPTFGCRATQGGPNNLSEVRASDGAVLATYTVAAAGNLAFDGANIWVTNFSSSNSVTKLHASDGTVLGTFNAGTSPWGIAFDGANMWIADYAAGTGYVSKL